MNVIYEPKGPAGEYAQRAANVYLGCPNGCLYCYAPASLRVSREAFYGRRETRPGFLENFRRDCERLQPQQRAHVGTKPIFLSFLCDPYQPLEGKTLITRTAILIAQDHGMPIEILTKCATRATRDFDLLANLTLGTIGNGFGVSLTCIEYKTQRLWEPNADTPSQRIVALEQAHGLGIRTFASLEPVLEPEETLRLIDVLHPFTDFFKVGKLNHHEHAKTIDWVAFGRAAVAKLLEHGCNFMLKEDLRLAMGLSKPSYAELVKRRGVQWNYGKQGGE